MACSDLIRLMVSDSANNGPATCPGAGFEGQDYPSCVPPEPAEGNIEYKLKLVDPTSSRLVHLVTQMRWRLREGNGEAIYEIGVADNGSLPGLVCEDMDASLKTLGEMAGQIGASTTVLRRCAVETDDTASEAKFVAEVLVRKMPDDHQVLPIRVAVLGSATAGKSTLLGVLTRGELDNGRGSARLNLLRHRHEVASGHTSSIGHEVLGFDKCGEVVNYEAHSAEDFCDHAAKLISFVDLAGHQKYQRTTMFGLSCSQPEFVMLVVSASRGVVGITRDHLGLTMALRVPLLVVITKTDTSTSEMCQTTIRQLSRMLGMPGFKSTVLHVADEAESIKAAANFTGGMITPVFTVSCVTGGNLALLKHFLNLIPARVSLEEQKKLEEEHAEFQIEDTYDVSGIGTVVGGILTRGVIRLGDELMLGPDQQGGFRRVLVVGLRRNRLPCRMIRAGQVATIAMPVVLRSEVHHGEVLLGLGSELQSVCWEFEADVYPLSQAQAIQANRQVTVHMGAIRQGAVVQEMSEPQLSMGKCSRVKFRFVRSAEFVCVGRRLIVRCGRCKAMGEVVAIKALPAVPADHLQPGKPRRQRLPTC